MNTSNRAICSDVVRVSSRNLYATIKAQPSDISPTAVIKDDQEDLNKKLAKYVALNQQLLIVLYVLTEISQAANQESNDTSAILVKYIGGSKKTNDIVTMFREMETVLESLIGITDPGSSASPKDPITVPTISKLITIYKSNKNQGLNYEEVYKWSIKLQENGLNYGPKTTPKVLPVRTYKDLESVMSDAYKNLSLNQIKTYRAHEEARGSTLSAEQEGAQSKGQDDINTVYQIQNDYSQMIGTLKNAIMTLTRFK